MEAKMASELTTKVRAFAKALTDVEADLDKLDGLEAKIKDAQAKVKELEAQAFEAARNQGQLVGERRQQLQTLDAQIDAKYNALAGVNAEVEAAVAKLAEVRAETNSAKLYHDQILDSVQSLRKQFA
jgi:chromosome segregation ATPase